MSSRDDILNAMRRNAPAVTPLPKIPAGIEYPDPVKQFEQVFTGVGGRCIRVANEDSLRQEFSQLEIAAAARIIASRVDGIPSRGIDLNSLKDPHEFAALDVAVLPAEFGVAENGAVWIPGSTLASHRAVFVIAQHLVLALNTREIVSNMHQAYDRVRIERPGFGLFLSGPSKTADIEQSLVIGAHGARSCTLFLIS